MLIVYDLAALSLDAFDCDGEWREVEDGQQHGAELSIFVHVCESMVTVSPSRGLEG